MKNPIDGIDHKLAYLTAAECLKNPDLYAAAPEMLSEIKELLKNAVYQDGYATVLTQDCESLERIVAKFNDSREIQSKIHGCTCGAEITGEYEWDEHIAMCSGYPGGSNE